MTADDLVREHYGLACYWADAFYLPDADRDDVRQIALLGIWKAARSFNGHGHFTAWAHMIVRRDLIDAVKSARRERGRPLNESVRTVDLALLPGSRDPADTLIDNEELRDLVARIKALRTSHRDALIRVVFCGEKQDKHTDNAVTKARKKLRAAA